MKVLSFSVFAFTALCNGALADQPPTEPTAFEAFATKPSARVLFTEHVGSIDSTDAKLKVTALVMDDVEHPAEKMRGVRFELENNTAQDQVYLDDTQLALAKREVATLEPGAELMKKNADAPYRVMGTQSCWMPKRPQRILCPDFYMGPDHSGLRLGAYDGPNFSFPDRKPAELTALIERAIDALEKCAQ
jgi:hypothetical protein